MDQRLLALLACPVCKGKLIFKNDELLCLFDRLAYPIHHEIPVMLEKEARLMSLEEKEQL